MFVVNSIGFTSQKLFATVCRFCDIIEYVPLGGLLRTLYFVELLPLGKMYRMDDLNQAYEILERFDRVHYGDSRGNEYRLQHPPG